MEAKYYLIPNEMFLCTIAQVEVKAIPIDKKDLGDANQVSQPDPMTFGGHPQPPLDVPYEVTVNNKTCFYAITIMKAYQNYSFEELRFMPPTIKRSSENMQVRSNGDGSYSATWAPSSIGWYSLMVTVDGYDMEDVSVAFEIIGSLNFDRKIVDFLTALTS